MAKGVDDLIIDFSGAPVNVLRPVNRTFLDGKRAEASFGSLWIGWRVMARSLAFLGVIGVLYVVGSLGYQLLWHSPLFAETEAIIDRYVPKSRIVSYHYSVDDVRHEASEYSDGSLSTWARGGAVEPMVFLRFRPEHSRLTRNVPSVRWMDGLLFLTVAMLPLLPGVMVDREIRRLTRLRDEATHVLEGTIHQAGEGFPASVYRYVAISPSTGRPIGGSITVGARSRYSGRLARGMSVAVMYRDDGNFEVL